MNRHPGMDARRRKRNPVFFAVVPLADGTYAVEASDGGSRDLLISFQTAAEAEAWIARLKGVIN